MSDVYDGFEWDSNKCLRNVEKHGIDFATAALVFDEAHADLPAKSVSGEPRRMAVGSVDENIITVIYVERERKIRIISARRARAGEKRSFLRLVHEG